MALFNEKSKRYLYWLFALGFIASSFLAHIAISSDRYFWLDEYFGLFVNIRKQSYFSLIASGARPQGSPVPLFYLLGKCIDESRKILKYLGLPFSAYYRLFFNVLFHISAIYYVAFVWKQNKFQFKNSLALFAFFLGLFAYLMVGSHIYFIDMFRSYVLWNILWFLASLHVAASIQKPSIGFWYLTSLYALLALTATASVFQIAALFCSDLLVRYLLKGTPKNGSTRRENSSESARRAPSYMKTPPIKTIFRGALKLSWQDMRQALWKHGSALLLPIAISVYYLPFVAEYDYPLEYGGTWLHFLRALLRYLPAFVLLLAVAILLLSQKKTRKYLIYVLPSLLLLVSTPMQMLLIQLKHFFVTSRQFLYFDLSYVFVALALFLVLDIPKAPKTWQPDLLVFLRERFTTFFQGPWGRPVAYFFANGAVFVLALAGFFVLIMALLPFALREKEVSINYNKYGPVRNTRILEKYIRIHNRIPGSTKLKKMENQDAQKDLEANAILFYEWLSARYSKNKKDIISFGFANNKLFIISVHPCKKCLRDDLHEK